MTLRNFQAVVVPGTGAGAGAGAGAGGVGAGTGVGAGGENPQNPKNCSYQVAAPLPCLELGLVVL